SDLRLVLRVEVHPGDQHNPKHAAAGLWSLLAQLGRERWPRLLRGDAEWGNEGVMTRAEQEGLPYLFRLRATANVKRALERAMAHNAGFETLPPAGRQRGADLQLVELVCPAGRSGSASRSHHPPAVAAAGDCPQNPARRPDYADGEQHTWPAADGAAGLFSHRRLLCPGARKNGGGGRRSSLVSQP